MKGLPDPGPIALGPCPGSPKPHSFPGLNLGCSGLLPTCNPKTVRPIPVWVSIVAGGLDQNALIKQLAHIICQGLVQRINASIIFGIPGRRHQAEKQMGGKGMPWW